MNTEHSEPPRLCLCSAVCVGRCEWQEPGRRSGSAQTATLDPSAMNFSPICQSPRERVTCLELLQSLCEQEEGFNICERQSELNPGVRGEGSPKLAPWGAAGFCRNFTQCHTYCWKSSSLCISQRIKCMEAEKKNNRASKKCQPTNIIKIAGLWQKANNQRRGKKIILT